MTTLDLEAPAPAAGKTDATAALRPLAVDLGLPVGAYYLVSTGLGAGMIAGFVASSAISAATMAIVAVRARRVSAMSALVLTTNVAGIALSLVSGGVRVTSGKDAILSCVIGLGILIASLRGRPPLVEGLRPFITKGVAEKDAAFTRLAADTRFAAILTRHSVIFGAAFLTDSLVRIGCAAWAPVSVLGWIGTAATVGALVVGSIVGGAITVAPLERLIDGELAARVAQSH